MKYLKAKKKEKLEDITFLLWIFGILAIPLLFTPFVQNIHPFLFFFLFPLCLMFYFLLGIWFFTRKRVEK